ncbi:MAG: OsmC family protein [Methylotenera sp.]|nr:OsmC family protein [Oligoflexia bacterium]
MITYPLDFPVEASTTAGTATTWTTRTPSLASFVPCAIPGEFGGPGGGYSPEDFFAMAAANCFCATFKVIAEKSKVSFEKLAIAGSLTVDRDPQGRPWMKAMRIEVTVHPGSTEPERIMRILEKTSQSCLVIHSLKTDVTFDFKIA